MGNAIVRFVLGVLGGLVAGWLTTFLIEQGNTLLWPPPAGLDPHNVQDIAAIMAAMPTIALVALVFAWLAGAFVGGFVAAKIATRWPLAAAVFPGLLILAGVVGMILMIPHPKWVSAMGLLLSVPMALLGGYLARRKSSPPLS